MKFILSVLISIFISIHVVAQPAVDKETEDQIIAEGKLLYKIEMASWYGTDIFLESFKDKNDKVGGYFSYVDNEEIRCIFFSNEESPKVLATIIFDESFDVNSARVDKTERELLDREYDLYTIRQKAVEEIQNDPLFQTYENTNLNLIPLIENSLKKVYVLTGPKNSGVVIIGNDYLLTFDENNGIASKKRLHKSIIPINYAEDAKEETITMHSHLPETGDYITPTDVCTLLLYGKFAKWKQHYVISKNYVSIWDCSSKQLAILSSEAWDKINNHQKSKKQRKKD